MFDAITIVGAVLGGGLVIDFAARTRRQRASAPHLSPVELVPDPADPAPAIPPVETGMKIFVELEEEAVEFLKSAGKVFTAFAMTEGQKFVALAKQSYLGTLTLNLVQVMQNQALSGVEKMEAVIAAITPAIAKFVANGGLPGLITSVEAFAIEFAQSVYNDFKAALAKVAGTAPAALAA